MNKDIVAALARELRAEAARLDEAALGSLRDPANVGLGTAARTVEAIAAALERVGAALPASGPPATDGAGSPELG
ncbi:hypothetical protein ABEG18_06795 [Alsobacter sp. KACC 23698]|uniref:Uncharacterized protein n=1 Tax=Alsobacter sp. KACC 23698 TaxID=3149229 RepID=A0AAU7JJA4_9HYPH